MFNESGTDKEWKYLKYASEKEYCMIASTKLGSEIQEMHKGEVKGNAFTVLNAL